MGAASLFISHRRLFTGHEKGFVMKNCSTLMGAVAPLALMVGFLLPIMPALAAETTGVAKTPERMPPPRIRTVITPPPAETEAEQTSETTEEDKQARSTAVIRSRTPRINTKAPVDVEAAPRIRTRVAAPADQDSVAVDSAQAAPRSRTTFRTPSTDSSVPAQVENRPRIRTRVVAPSNSDAASTTGAEPVPRNRVRLATPQTDRSTPAEIESTPRVRTRIAQPSSEEASPDAETPRRRSRDTAGEVPSDQSDEAATTGSARQTVSGQRDKMVTEVDTKNVSRDFTGKVKPNAIILKPGTYQQILGKLPVTRTLDLTTIKANPTITLGATMFDFNPMLDNPKSLPNIGKRLQAMPQLVEIVPATMTASQIKQGLVVRSVLSYRLKSGACTMASNRLLLTNAGISCFTYKAIPAREADFSKPASIEYVKDLGERANALAQAREQSQINAADIQQNVDQFRVILKDPAQRAQVVTSIGDAETTRLEQLNDTALAGELVNFHDVTIEEVAFVPVMQPIPPSDAWFKQAQKSLADAQLKRLAAADAQLAGATEATSYPIGEFQYLAGFTLGSAHEWRQGVSTTIKWCVFGCKKTYFAEAWAGFHYGFGLRFPMRFSGTYNFTPGGNGKATLETTLVTNDGNIDDYRKTGLPEDKLFGGQELVAEFGANAGIHANLPLIGGIGPIELSPEIKLTDYLPGRLKGGNLTPPMPNDPIRDEKVVLEQVDLLGERANLGIVSAKVHPAVYIGLESESMSLMVTGNNLSVPLTGGIKTIDLPMAAGQVSSFTVGTPNYNIGMRLTPGLTARLSLNLAVWGTSVDWDVKFPSAKIEIPSGGVDFGCHEGTVCARTFNLGPLGAVSVFKKDLMKWAVEVDAYWLPKCLDEICTTSVKLKRYDVLEAALAQESSLKDSWVSADIYRAPMRDNLAVADTAAEKYVEDSKVRKAQKASDTSSAMSKIALAYYTPQCRDSLCVDNVAILAAIMGPRAKQIAAGGIYRDETAINKMVNKEFGPKFVAEVDASKMRVDMKNAKSVQQQLGKKGKLPVLQTN
jgi:hypothetical protein